MKDKLSFSGVVSSNPYIFNITIIELLLNNNLEMIELIVNKLRLDFFFFPTAVRFN